MNRDLELEILEIRKQIEKETNKDIKKILLQQKKYLEQLRKEIGSIYMKNSDDEGNLKMNVVDRHNTIKKMEKELINIRKVLAGTIITIAGSTLIKSYVDSYYKIANTLNKGIDIGINYKILRPEFINAVINGKFENMTYSDRIWKNTDWLANKLYDVIGKGITEGTSIQKLSKEIKNTFGSSSYQAYRLVNTEMAKCVSNAQDEIYKDSGVVNKVMYNATLDDLTSDICQELDGQIFDINDNYPKPPMHPNCRSVIIPIVEGWNPKIRRENIKDESGNKQIIEYQNYKDWAKSKGID